MLLDYYCWVCEVVFLFQHNVTDDSRFYKELLDMTKTFFFMEMKFREYTQVKNIIHETLLRWLKNKTKMHFSLVLSTILLSLSVVTAQQLDCSRIDTCLLYYYNEILAVFNNINGKSDSSNIELSRVSLLILQIKVYIFSLHHF